jgi:mRNA interferase RelE/StbE
MSSRQQAHDLIDRLPESQLSALVGFLESIVDPVTAALGAAPVDDEEETPEERAAVAQARRSLERNGGKGVSHAEAMRRLGLE